MDNLVDFTKSHGAGGLVYFKWTENGLETAVEKFLGKELVHAIATAMGAGRETWFFLSPISGRRPTRYSARSDWRSAGV